MKKLVWITGALGIGLSAAVGGHIAFGADHRDADSLLTNSAADLNDLYAWMNADASKLNLVMTVQPFAAQDATFSPNVEYVFHVYSMASYGAATRTPTNVICEFASATSVQCWVGNSEYVSGDPSNPAGLESADHKVKIFAGQRQDPFFFQLTGFRHAVTDAEADVAANRVTLDANGCPTFQATDLSNLQYDVSHDGTCTNPDPACVATSSCFAHDATCNGGNDFTNTFAAANGVALVVQLDKTLVNSGGSTLSVWASTNMKP